MNCISGWTIFFALAACTSCSAPASETAGSGAVSKAYKVHYELDVSPGASTVDVTMTVLQDATQLRELSFATTGPDVRGVDGDGELIVGADAVTWRPAHGGGTLRWTVAIGNRRNADSYDAWLGPDWGIFRAEDAIPRARTRVLKGSTSVTSLSFRLPGDWTAVTEYRMVNGTADIDIPERRFDQPRGWILAGDLGIRRETIAGTRVAVAAAKGQAVRRMDMLALLNWTLPELNSLLPEPIPRLTIVSGGDPMWRGALSAPESVYIHADRPLISENATSTLVHEAVHVALKIRANTGFDWITEGLAEYYSLELLKRGGAITPARHRTALHDLEAWARQSKSLCARQSTGARTALAVLTLKKLDRELREASAGQATLDAVFAELAATTTSVSVQTLQDIATKLLSKPAKSLDIDNLPGCDRYIPAPAD